MHCAPLEINTRGIMRQLISNNQELQSWLSALVVISLMRCSQFKILPTHLETDIQCTAQFSRENLSRQIVQVKKERHNSDGREKISYCSSYKTCLEFCLFRWQDTGTSDFLRVLIIFIPLELSLLRLWISDFHGITPSGELPVSRLVFWFNSWLNWNSQY